MSTKIWEAYRLSASVNLWEFLRDVRRKAETAARADLVTRVKAIVTDYRTNPKDRALYDEALKRDKDSPPLSPWNAMDYLRMRYKEAERNEWIMFDFGVSITVRECEGRFYLIPYDRMGVLKFLRRDPRVSDFHYQNQTDRPPRMTNREWGHRRRTWDKMFGGYGEEGWWDVVVLEILTTGNWYRVTAPIIMDKKLRRWFKRLT